MPDQPPTNPRPAQPEGKTLLQYSPNGEKLIVAGLANFVRTYNTGDEDNVVIVDGVPDETNAVITGNDYFITGNEDGLVSQFDISKKKLDKLLVRSSLPIRALALTPDERWVAVSSDEVIIKVVNRHDIEQIQILRDHPKIIKHLSYDPEGRYLAASCIDGIIYLYSVVDKDEPSLLRSVDGIIRRLEVEEDATSECVWHPDGQVFACATATRDIATISVADGAQQRSFVGGHMADILSLAWSANGALLASTSRDGGLVLWETKTQSMIKKFEYERILNVTWHPRAANYLNWTNTFGEVVVCPNFLKDESHLRLLTGPRVAPPYFHNPHGDDDDGSRRRPLVNGRTKPRPRNGTPDSLDLLLNEDGEHGAKREEDDMGEEGDEEGQQEEAEDWIEDDDGAGYHTNTNSHGKRPNRGFNNHHANKRLCHGPNVTHPWRSNAIDRPPRIHKPFQPGATPWRGNRKYLCLNLTGFVWTLDQDTHHTVTVEFYDRDRHRDFHLTDPYRYDKACLNDRGTLFACPPSSSSSSRNNTTNHDPSNDHPATIFYRPHETWTSTSSRAGAGGADWRTPLPPGESATAIALSKNFITVFTTAGYVRVYTLFGTPWRIWRRKSAGPVVTCAAFGDYVMTVANGPVVVRVGGEDEDGYTNTTTTQLVYGIEDVRREEVCQDGDVVALGQGATLKNLFFSHEGDPYIYDSTGTLLILLHWRQPCQAKWVPLLDTSQLSRLASGRKQESYWPVAVAQGRFHAIILKGGDQYPYFPRPLLSEFEFQVPVFSSASAAAKVQKANNLAGDEEMEEEEEEGEGEGEEAAASNVHANNARLEESLVRSSILCSVLEDGTNSQVRGIQHQQQQQLARHQLEVDKILLQLLAVECREGEERGMKALEIVRLMRTDSGGGGGGGGGGDSGSGRGKMMEAAAKVAARWGRGVLEDKIRKLGERRLMGLHDDDDGGGDDDADVMSVSDGGE